MVLFSFSIFFSGLRSILIPGLVILTVTALPYFNRTLWRGNLFPCVASLLILTIIIVGNPYSLRERIESSVYVVSKRMQQTLLNEDGMRLDPKGGRKEEAEFALEAFRESAGEIDYLIGRGYGFAYYDFSKDGEITGHVHITPIAFFVRYGFLGVFFYSIVLFDVIWIFLRKKKLPFPYRVTLLIWYSSSLFAGTILFPTFWLFYGYCRWYSRLMR